MAGTHIRSSTSSLVVLSLLAFSRTAVAQDASSTGVVEFEDSLASDGLFEYAAYDQELLPPPERADYQDLTEDELDQIFERTVDGDEANRRYARRSVNKRHSTRATVSCTAASDCSGLSGDNVSSFKCNKARGYCVISKCVSGATLNSAGTACEASTIDCTSTAVCTASGYVPGSNAHAYCNRTKGYCVDACNSGYTLSGGSCVKDSITCSATADCTAEGYDLPANSHYRCSSGTCTFACNSGYEYDSAGTGCEKEGTTTTTTTTSAAATSTATSGLGKAWAGTSSFSRAGYTGVGAMQATLVDDDHIVIYDKAENNALKDASGASAWGSVYSISGKSVRALNLVTNSFCAGGGWISNGTLVNIGGNPQQTYINNKALNGLAGIRLFTPCDNDQCDVYENHARMRLTSARWYPSTTRLTDGSLLIAGGMIAGGYNNQESTDNPTFEYYPPKGDGLQFYSQFLHDALDSNLYPIMITLPSGYVFMAANQIAMLYDPENNVERRIKSFPNGVTITYPGSAANALLPLTVENNWTPSVLFCGGTTADLDADPSKMSATYPASKQCSRMELTASGIKAGWEVDEMPTARVMGDAILMPDGKILIVNGAGTGIAGYGNVKDEVGASNARSPVKQPVLYDPNAELGSRFSTNFPKATYERLYHSSATLLPSGEVWIAGSNPNDGVSTTTYATRYQVEILSPPYMSLDRPTYSGLPSKILYGASYTLTVDVPSGTSKVQAVIIDIGYSTHGVHMSNRYVELESSLSGKKLTIKGPKNTGIYPPAPGWLYILADGVPSTGKKVMVGPGASPPTSESARRNMLAKTGNATNTELSMTG